MNVEQSKLRHRRWLRRSLIALAVAAVLVAALGVAAKFWILPAVIRSQAIAALGDYWTGPVSLGKVEFNYFGPITLRDAELRDADGHVWVRLARLDARLRDWPGVHPVLEGLEASGLTLRPKFNEQGEMDPPLRIPETEGPSPIEPYVDLRSVRVTPIDVDVFYPPDQSTAVPELGLSLERSGDDWRVRLGPLEAEVDALSLKGTFDPNGPVDLRLSVQHSLTSGESGLMLRLPETTASGRIDADVTLRGSAKQLESLRFGGSVALARGKLTRNDRRLVWDASLTLRLEGTSAALASLTAHTPGGRVDAEGTASIPLGRAFEYAAALRAGAVPLTLLRELDDALPIAGGTGSVDVEVFGSGFEEARLHGRASVDAKLTHDRIHRLAGRTAFDVTLRNLSRPARLAAKGRAVLGGWRLWDGEGLLARLDGARILADRRRIVLRDARGSVLGAPVRLAGRADLPEPDRPLRYVAALRADALPHRAAMGARVPLPAWFGQAVGRVDAVVRGGAEGLSAEGVLAAETGMQLGPLRAAAGRAAFALELPSFADPRPVAVARVRDGTLEDASDAPGPLAERVSAVLRYADGRLAVRDLRAATRAGELAGDGSVALAPDPGYAVRLRTDRLAIEPVLAMLGHSGLLRRGRLAVELSAVGRGGRLLRLRARGQGAAAFIEFPVRTTGGAFDADVTLRELAADAGPRAAGEVSLSDAHVDIAGAPTLHDLDARVTLEPRAVRVAELTARSPYGPLTGRGRLAWGPDRPLAASGQVDAPAFDAGAAARDYLAHARVPTGAMDLRAAFELRGDVLELTVASHALTRRARPGDRAVHAVGDLDADLTFRELTTDAPVVASGSARLDGWDVHSDGRRILRNLTATAEFDRTRVDVTELSARTGRGRLSAFGHVDWGVRATTQPSPNPAATTRPASPVRYDARVHTTDLDLPPLLALGGIETPFASSSIDLDADLSGTGADAARLDANGSARLSWTDGALRALAGGFRVNADLSGPLAEPRQLAARGDARFEDWTVTTSTGERVREIDVSILMLGRSADVSSLRGKVLGGRLTGRARIDAPRRGRPEYRGQIDLRKLDLGKLRRAAGDDPPKDAGTLSLRYAFRADGFTLDDLRGSGVLAMGDSRSEDQAPVVAVLGFLGLAPRGARAFDVHAAFGSDGPVITIKEARLASQDVAIVVQPGGTVNLRTRQFRADVVAGLLNDIDDLFGAVPVLRLITSLTSRLNRLEVSGQFDDRESIRVRKRPLKDLAEGSADFFERTVRTGGDLGESLVDALRNVAP